MSEESARLRIPYLAASQAQKHVTHNEALTLLDTLCQASVVRSAMILPIDETAPVSEEPSGATEGGDAGRAVAAGGAAGAA